MRITGVRQWDQGALDRVWITDLTYLRCAQGWVYLCAVRDAHSRRVLGYAMGEQHNMSSPGFCVGIFRPLSFVLLCVGFLLVAV